MKIPFTCPPAGFIVRRADLLAVQQAQSSEQTRYYLRGVHLQADPAGALGVRLVATDGHILLTTLADDPACQLGADLGHMTVQFDPAEKAFKAKEGNGTAYVIGDRATGLLQVVTVMDADGLGAPVERIGVCEFADAGGTFPDWPRVLPPTSGDPIACDFNPALLARLVKAGDIWAAARGHRSQAVRMVARHEGAPIDVRFAVNPDARGVLMPVSWTTATR